MKVIALSFMITAICLLLLYSVVKADDPPLSRMSQEEDGSQYGQGYKQIIHGIPVIHLKGTSYEMGRQEAYLNRDIFVKGISFFANAREYLTKDMSWPKIWFLTLVTDWRSQSIFNRYDKEIQEEIRGIVDGLKGEVPPKEIINASAIFDLAMNYACTTFAAKGAATLDGKLLIGRNFDFGGAGYFDIPFITVYEPTAGYRFASIGVPVWNMSGVTSFNEKGLVVIAHIALTKDTNLKDKPMGELIRHIVQYCGDIDEAVALIKKTKRMCGINLILAEGATQKVAVVEISASDFEIRWPEKDTIWATNHYLSPKMKDKVAPTPYLFDFQIRYARLRQLMENNYGRLDIPTAVEILRDHYALNRGKETVNNHVICAAFKTEYPFSPNNDVSVVFEPGSFNFWLSKGREPAAMGEFVGFNLQELFAGKEGEVMPAVIPASDAPSNPKYKKLLSNYQTFNKAQESFNKRNYVNAIIDLKRVIEIEPDHSEAYYLLAYIYFHNEKYELAKEYANKVIAIEEELKIPPQYKKQTGLIYTLLGRIAKAEGQKAQAANYFDQAGELGKKYPHANNEYAAKLAKKYRQTKFLGIF